ncbi:MAG: GMC family oxidoreductase [Deltaproteobacteria bacterium]|nr:GMC family oxidoreductase [Deltaproteobacteria bacterium]
MSGEIIQGRSVEGDLELRAQVCIVGSGAGGAVVAKTLSEAGLDVIVIEEGGHTPPEVYGKYRPTETLRNLAREGGTAVTMALGDSPLIAILQGRTVGGSSVLTGGVCFRIPESVTHRWATEHGLPGFSEKELEACYAEVEREVHVETVPEHMRSKSTVLFGEGMEKLGYGMKPLRRNTKGCCGCSRCNFGCPHQAKLSVDLTYLRKALQHGTRIYADCRADELLIENGRAAGVVGRLVDGPTGHVRGKFRVHADTVVVCAGSLHTPLLLMRSGLGKRSEVLGRRLTLHPASRVAAFFDTEVKGWQGALQSTYCDDLEDEGITFTSVYAPLNILAAAVPGVGSAHHERIRKMGQLAVFGVMVHDQGGGSIYKGFGREPFVTYRMAKEDKHKLFRGVKIAAEAFFAAGAREVLLPFYGFEPVKSVDELRALDPRTVPARLGECAAFHPLGSARMGSDAYHGVVDPNGQSYDVEGLYVADGSLFPTSIGVNSQLPIMTVATRIAWGLREKLASKAPVSVAS